MNLLAFDTSTEILHVAVQRGAAASHAPLEHTGPGGAQASATLIPAIHALLAQAGLGLADLDAIVFGRGPGSFTGLRTACSVAQGLAFGSGVPVLAVDTLLAVAEDAYHREGAQQVVALLDARMDEVYFAAYEREAGRWRQQGEFGLGTAGSRHRGARLVTRRQCICRLWRAPAAGSRPHRGHADGRRAPATGPCAAGRWSGRARRRRHAPLHSR